MEKEEEKKQQKTLLETYSILHLTESNVNAQPLNDFVLSHARTRVCVYLRICVDVDVDVDVDVMSAQENRECD